MENMIHEGSPPRRVRGQPITVDYNLHGEIRKEARASGVTLRDLNNEIVSAALALPSSDRKVLAKAYRKNQPVIVSWLPDGDAA